MRCCFNIFDIDHSGEISLNEFYETMKKLGLDSESYGDLFGDRTHMNKNIGFEGLFILSLSVIDFTVIVFFN